jgi:hypothetical protein
MTLGERLKLTVHFPAYKVSYHGGSRRSLRNPVLKAADVGEHNGWRVRDLEWLRAKEIANSPKVKRVKEAQ